MTARHVAVLGLGAMGQRMAARLVASGHRVTVWSRSGSPPGSPLREQAAATPQLAVRDADLAIAMVTDDAASRAVWLDAGGQAGAALDALRPGAIAIECSTLSPAWVSELAAAARARGCAFVEAPVVGSRPQAEAGALTILAGGEAADVASATPVLACLAGAIHHLGPTPAGAIAKLIVNALFGVQVAALAELLGWADRAPLAPGALAAALEGLPVTSAAARAAAAGMRARRFEPMFPLALAAKDLRYAVAAAAAVGAAVPLVAATGQVLAEGEARGLGAENLTAVARLYAPEPT